MLLSTLSLYNLHPAMSNLLLKMHSSQKTLAVKISQHKLPSFSDSSVGKESACSAGDSGSIPGSGRSAGEGTGYPGQFLGFPGSSAGEESACNVGELGSILALGRSPGEGKGYPPQYSCLENPMDRGAWWATVHGVAKSRT